MPLTAQEDVVSLMRKRVYDTAGVLGKGAKVMGAGSWGGAGWARHASWGGGGSCAVAGHQGLRWPLQSPWRAVR
jgi:hypothetical protein